MATKLSPFTPRSQLHRGSGLELERTSPSAKTTSGMFGDNNPKKRTLVSRGTELNQVQEELAKTKEQLSLMEKSKTNLLHDLARSKRQVEELTAKLQDVTEELGKNRMRVEDMENASLTAAEHWQVEVEMMKEQYEAAILELQANKQAMESLNHELILSIKAKNEAVRLAGEAMNAAESTAKRVEDLSAELVAARKTIAVGNSALTNADKLKSELSYRHEDANGGAGPCEGNGHERAACLPAAKEIELGSALQEYTRARIEFEGWKQDLALAQNSQTEFMDLKASLEDLQRELRLSKEAEKKSELQLHVLTCELDQVTHELANAKNFERALKCQNEEMTSVSRQIHRQLADSKQSEDNVLVAEKNAQATFDKCSADIWRIKESESAALASLAKVSTQLEEAEEKLSRVALEGVILEVFLKSLEAELTGNQTELAGMVMKETSARLRADTLNTELTNLREAHVIESQLANEKIVASKTGMESLRLDSERKKLELVSFMEKESSANANVEALVVELKQTQDELMELRRQNMNACERGNLLSEELENNKKELMTLKEREMSMTYRYGNLMDDLEAKELEVLKLTKRLASADDKAAALAVILETSLAELARLKKKESAMNSKAAALSVALASLSEQTESKLLELKDKEKGASVKAYALHQELRNISLGFERALTDARVAKEDANKLYESLQIAYSERDQAKWQEQIAISEATQSKEQLERALTNTETANFELQKALDAVHAAEQRAFDGALEAKVFQEKFQAAQNEVLLVKHETEEAREKLQAALVDLQRMSKELEHEKQEAQLVSQEVLALKAEVLRLKGQAITPTEETEAAKLDVARLRDLLKKVKSGEVDTQSAHRTNESRIDGADFESVALQLGACSLGKDEEEEQSMGLGKAPAEVAFSQEKFTDLNLRPWDMEDRLTIATTELEASIANGGRLSRELEAIKIEKECKEKAVLDMQQLLADTEKVKSKMEAEMQRLLDVNKQQQMAKGAFDIPVHSEVNGYSFPPDCREDKTQVDFVEDITKLNLSSGKEEMFKWEESVNLGVVSKEELACPLTNQAESPEHDEGSVKDESTFQDESSSLPMKKKKKNLLGRLGNLLDKKKHSQQQTP